MKVVVAGSRTIKSYIYISKLLNNLYEDKGVEITELVCGMAHGVDIMAKLWADHNNIPVNSFPADWGNLTTRGAIVKRNKHGIPYNVKAGYQRNIKMLNYAECLVAIWDGNSRGTAHIIDEAKARKITVYIYHVEI